MKIQKLLVLMFSVAIIPGWMHCTQETINNKKDILALLPDQNQLKGWKPFGEPQYAKGEDLFLLINGGAEIYYEYGFKQAVIHSYSHEDESSVNVEIYEMEDAESAYGIYSFKIGEEGKDISVGTQGRLEDYYLNFWKGPYVVTLIGFDNDSTTQQSLKKIAGLIDDTIAEKGTPPALINYISELSYPYSKITYIEGNLGLYNQYEFDTKNIFGVSKGVVARYERYQLFLLHYADSSEREQWLQTAEDHLKENNKFSDYTKIDKGFTIKDSQDQLVRVTSCDNFILIYVGEDEPGKAEEVLKDVEEEF